MRRSIFMLASSSRTRLLLLIALGAAFALAAGLTAAASGAATLFVAGVAGASIFLAAWMRPRSALWLLAGSSVFLLAVPVSARYSLNLIDVLIIPALCGAWFWYRGRSGADVRSGVDRAATWLVSAVLLFYGTAVLSLARLAASGNAAGAWHSLLLLGRSIEGAMLYFLVVRLVRAPEDLRRIRSAICVGVLLSLAANAVWIFARELPRAGCVWILGAGGGTIVNPNEAGAGVLLAWAAVLAIPPRRWQAWVLLSLSTALLLATASRSAMLAWIVFCLAYGIRGRARWFWAAPAGLVALWPLLPSGLTGRFLRTVALQPGSFEAFSSLIRVYSWRAAWEVFLQHPILGVGYIGFRFVSAEHNPLRLVLGTAESFYLEVASGMGATGLLFLLLSFVAFYRLCRAARAASPRDSTGNRLGRVGPPLLLGTAVANLTGDNLAGMLGVAQMALFAGLLTQAARMGGRETAGPEQGA
jgi:O-Antigen ligase